MTTTPPPNLAGQIVAGRYKVEHLIGQGGMGSVWLGRHVSLGQPVAIKFLYPKLARSVEARRRFEIEAKAAARINSRHAVKVHDHGVTEDGHPYLVMDYLEGTTLDKVVRERGPLPLPEVTAIVTQIARALEAAHEAGIIHRDLKPDNVFFANDPEAGRLGYTVKVVDFGIAKLLHEDGVVASGSTQAGTVIGTPHYMSPEALTATAPVGPASDVWSLGACAFVAVTGQAPFYGDVIGEVVLRVCSAPLPSATEFNPAVPRQFDAWFHKACARKPSDRFQTAREAALALQKLEKDLRTGGGEVSYAVRPTQPSNLELEVAQIQPQGRGRMLAGILVGSAIAIGGIGFYASYVQRQANLELMQTFSSTPMVPDAASRFETEDSGELRSDAGVAVDAVPAPSASSRP